jgi:hypothetical protein
MMNNIRLPQQVEPPSGGQIFERSLLTDRLIPLTHAEVGLSASYAFLSHSSMLAFV